MSIEENKALIRRYVDQVVNGGNMDLVDEFLDADYTGIGGTREGYKKDAYRASFPDLHHTVEGMVAEGDSVWVRYTVRGTHTGAGMLGLPAATGKEIAISNVCIYTIRGGKILSSWGLVATCTLLQQLGILPSMAELVEQLKNREG